MRAGQDQGQRMLLRTISLFQLWTQKDSLVGYKQWKIQRLTIVVAKGPKKINGCAEQARPSGSGLPMAHLLPTQINMWLHKLCL